MCNNAKISNMLHLLYLSIYGQNANAFNQQI